MGQRPTNWAGNLTFHVEHVQCPSSIDELRNLVAESTSLRVLGSGHSFSSIADTRGDLIALTKLTGLPEINSNDASVTVPAGVRYGELSAFLQANGRALHNLGSLPHISVAGSCATATHGSGVTNGTLATAVTAMTLVTTAGDVVTLDSSDDAFPGAVVSLGSLGVVVDMTLRTEPTYSVEQYVYENLPRGELEDHFEEIVSGAYSVSLFTQWRDPSIPQVWLKHRPDLHGQWLAGQEWFGARLADGPRHPLPGISPVSCTEQAGVPGPWHERLPHFRLEFTPSNGDEVQSEYFVPRESGLDAFRALSEASGAFAHLVQASEVRTIAADEHWMSPCYGRDTVAFHFTWLKDQPKVLDVLPAVEQALAPYHPIPHWAKLTTMPPADLRRRFPRIGEFRALATEMDPAGKFRNDFTDRAIFR